MVFAVNLEFKNKVKDSILDDIIKSAKILNKSYVESGVIGEDERTLRMAYLNEFGGITSYDKDPHKGEEVMVPPRPFVDAPERVGTKELGNFIEFMAEGNLNQKGIKQILDGCGEIMAKQQKERIEQWGDIKDNSERTVDIKGFNRPLHDSNNQPFPIKTKVVFGGAV